MSGETLSQFCAPGWELAFYAVFGALFFGPLLLKLQQKSFRDDWVAWLERRDMFAIELAAKHLRFYLYLGSIGLCAALVWVFLFAGCA